MKDRDTLIPCEACGGKATRLEEYPDGSYRSVTCKWCHHGYTDKTTAMMFRRWLKIRQANRKRCSRVVK